MAERRVFPPSPRRDLRQLTLALPNLSLTDSQRTRVIRVWHRYRLPFAGALILSTLGMAIAVGWKPGFLVALLPLISYLDSKLQLKRGTFTAPVTSMAVDITSIFLAFGLANLEDAAIGIPFAYVLVAALLLLPPLIAMPLVAYAGAWYFVIVLDLIPFAPVESATTRVALATSTDLIFSLALIGILGMVMTIINRESSRREHRIRLEHALAEFSATLLDGEQGDPLRLALEVLVEATEAGAVYVQRNVDHPDLGLCSTLICEAAHHRTRPRPEGMWDLIPWSALPTARDELSTGRPHVYDISRLSPDMQRRFEQSGIRSELAFPIFIESKWAGVIGFDDIEEGRAWNTSDRILLNTAAQILGTHFQRTRARAELDDHVANLDQQHRYQAALADCSQALLATTDEHAVDEALRALLSATEADHAYIDINYEDPELGLCTEIVHEADRPGTEHRGGREAWYSGPYRNQPTSFERLSRGEPAIVITSQLTGDERHVYENDGIKSELCLPLSMHDTWVGSIAFADHAEERHWGQGEIRALHTAAQMIGAFWERREAKVKLEDLVTSLNARLTYEEALSQCSQALLRTTDDSAIDEALKALLGATGSHNVFIDTNFDDPELGLCARVTHEVIRPGFEDVVDPEIWLDEETGIRHHTVTAFAEMPNVRSQLERRLPAVIEPETLPEDDRGPYAEGPIQTELNIPIFVEGRWWGSIGFADYVAPRTWRQDEVALLQTAGEMIGSFLERRESRARLEAMIESKDEFVAAVSHELRTPLTTVVGLSHELRSRRADFNPNEIDDFIYLIAEQSTEVANIVEDLLVAARSNTGTLVIRSQPVDVEAEIATILQIDQGLHRRLAVQVIGACSKAWVDPGRMRQIIRNLLTNADRYGGDQVRVMLQDTKGGISIAVEDNGPGIPEEMQDTIFEPYGRAHAERTQPASVGLGLAVARSLARLMGGDLIHERRGDTTVFELQLLAAEADSGFGGAVRDIA
jgi:signal transduction histidine kinase